MREKITLFFEVFLFFLGTFLLYLLHLATLPVFQDSHSLLVTNEFSGITRSSFITVLLFSSSALCVLVGSLLVHWAPPLTLGMMANLWGVVFLFAWVDPVFALSVETQSLKFTTTLALGAVFIYLFFFILHFLGMGMEGASAGVPHWKQKTVSFWIWGWIGFYFGLSILMALESLQYSSGFRLPLAFGAMVPCFFFYAFNLFLRKAEGVGQGRLSQVGRWVFVLWLLALTGLWIVEKWAV